MKTLPITVLVHEGPIARMYLASLKQENFRVQKIILMVQSQKAGTNKAIARFLPLPIRKWLAKKSQELSHHYWPRHLMKTKGFLVNNMIKELETQWRGSRELIDEIYSPLFKYERYAEAMETLWVKNLKDPNLAEKLEECNPAVFLYTGGGIVPDRLLELPGKQFLHIHPGFLPHVRGADGVLWSYLVRGKPGASCFKMAKGIDQGELIIRQEFPTLQFKLDPSRARDDVTLYRALFSFYDPIIRSQLLIQMVRQFKDFSDLKSEPQDLSQGETYHFMHPKVRQKALKLIFN